jgi:peptidoglycan/xylan/chitin deacetylase (PgdA/CDA1 family)
MFAHGLMFHHFHDCQHPKNQGAISRDDFERILDRYGNRILTASDWLARSNANHLSPENVCVTFDDALRCQIDVALPVLRERGMTAFWFVYSSVFEGKIDRLELFRYFRTVKFKNFDSYCDAFISAASGMYPQKLSSRLDRAKIEQHLAEYSFYSFNDRLYRYVRDRILVPTEYDLVLRAMMSNTGFDIEAAKPKLCMTEADIKLLAESNHEIGLHSYSHPTYIEGLTSAEQRDEYERNHRHLEETLGKRPLSMAHPCNSYNADTLSILDHLGVEIGFRANLAHGPAMSRFEIPREDHANIMAAMQ